MSVMSTQNNAQTNVNHWLAIIRNAMQSKGWKLGDLSEAMVGNKTTMKPHLSRILSGKLKEGPAMITVEKIAWALGFDSAVAMWGTHHNLE
jgi:hypothetical protein